MEFDYESIWEGTWGDMQRFGPIHRHHRRIFQHLLQKLSTADIVSVADVGCGEGSNLAFMQRLFPSVQLYGFDISQTALNRARSRVEACLSVFDIEHESPTKAFDLVVCSDVLEHLPDDGSAIRHLYEMTGKFCLVASVQGRFRQFEKSIGHVRSYTPGELVTKVRNAGYRVLATVEWGFPLYSPLYRDLFEINLAENLSHGQYGFWKRVGCQLLYSLFFLNRQDRGDIIFLLLEK